MRPQAGRCALSLAFSVGLWACAAPEAARGQVAPASTAASVTPNAATTSPASATSAKAAGTSAGSVAAEAAASDEIEMVSPDGTRRREARGKVPESVGWGTDAEGRRVPVTRIEFTDGPVREIRRYGPGGAFLDVTRSSPPPRPLAPEPRPTPPVP